jgi:leucyl/phenylalanyl-tRNA--protein transferase
MPVFLLSEKISFPSPNLASREGLLAVGGDLNQQRLLLAYRLGIFPWFADDDPILWWSPDPRLVLYPEEMRVSRTLKKIIKKELFRMTIDSAFDQVINSCAQIRVEKNEGTWIGQEMIDAYCRLHESGFAHSVFKTTQKFTGGTYH